ncbi:hypothetical protein H671_1g0803 [Cricetulus griseus]|nr:hypothetical protein H671_1g0803 [Cricetulus griseus]
MCCNTLNMAFDHVCCMDEGNTQSVQKRALDPLEPELQISVPGTVTCNMVITVPGTVICNTVTTISGIVTCNTVITMSGIVTYNTVITMSGIVTCNTVITMSGNMSGIVTCNTVITVLSIVWRCTKSSAMLVFNASTVIIGKTPGSLFQCTLLFVTSGDIWFNSQHPYGITAICNSSSRVSDTLF